MRHFSGEFEGVRLLMLDELDAIAGGDGEDTDDGSGPGSNPDPDPNDDIVVTGHRITMTSNLYPDWAPIIIDLPSDPDPAPGVGGFNVGGDPCPTARSELDEALANLSNGSETAAAIIASARENYVNITLVRTNTTTPGEGHDVQYDNGTKTVSWDPFGAVSGTNPDGTYYQVAPTMTLAHELVHWANPSLSESDVMRISNEIANEMNASGGYNFGHNRNSHTGDYYTVSDTDSETFDLNRPGC